MRSHVRVLLELPLYVLIYSDVLGAFNLSLLTLQSIRSAPHRADVFRQSEWPELRGQNGDRE